MTAIKIPVYQPNLLGNEQKYVEECIASSWISSKGPFFEKFERLFADYIKISYATSVSNGTVALHLALLSLGIKEGDEVIVPSLTYVASVNAIRYVGATPIFVDSLLDTWQLDPDDVQKKITSKTKAIMAVHLYGQACDMVQLRDIAEQHKIFLIEDCAEAIGTRISGQHVGTFGDVATFSFYANKAITTGEGGMVVARDKKFIDYIVHLKNQGVSKVQEYWHDVIGYNYRMTNIQAAIGLAQLERVDDIVSRKIKLAARYRERLQNLPLIFHEEVAETTHSHWMVSILTHDRGERDALRDFLKQNGIETRPFFAPVHKMSMYTKFGGNDCEQAIFLSERGINLPSYPELTDLELDMICGSIKNFFSLFTSSVNKSSISLLPI